MVLAVQAEKMQSSEPNTIAEIFWNSVQRRWSYTEDYHMNCFDVLYPCDSVVEFVTSRDVWIDELAKRSKV